jgi:aminoglycoside phosphotransferase (APT) family kinase protein
MDRISGRVPGDFPSYHKEGWFAELPMDHRATAWLAGIEAMHQIHSVDVEAAGLSFLADHSNAVTGAARELARYEDQLEFFAPDSLSLADRALTWLHDNLPSPEHGSPVLLWGDARIGNIIFDGSRVAAVLDWEMAAIGPPEIDVAWYLYLDRHLSEGIGAARLPGLPDAKESVRHYESLIDRELTDLEYYEVLAGFRFFLITARVTSLAVAAGIVPSKEHLPLHRNAANLLRATLVSGGG